MHGLSAGVGRFKGSEDDSNGASVIVAFRREESFDLPVLRGGESGEQKGGREGGRGTHPWRTHSWSISASSSAKTSSFVSLGS